MLSWASYVHYSIGIQAGQTGWLPDPGVMPQRTCHSLQLLGASVAQVGVGVEWPFVFVGLWQGKELLARSEHLLEILLSDAVACATALIERDHCFISRRMISIAIAMLLLCFRNR